ncbi:MAG: PAS domain S-box protein [Spirochaetes bacterium]|nr:PAS domain S-box protein [Spirochaetota bacterium]
MKILHRKPKPALNLARTVSFPYVVFMIVAFLFFGGLLLIYYIQSQHAVIAAEQQHLVQEAAGKVSAFIRGKVDLLSMTTQMDDLLRLPYHKRRQVLESLLGMEPSFRQIIISNSREQIAAYASRLSTQASTHFIEELDLNTVINNTKTGDWISHVYIDQVTSEPLVILAVPVRNIFRDYTGFLAAELNLKFMWDIVDRLIVGTKGKTYVVNSKGNLIAFGDTARVLRVENVANLKPVMNFVNSKTIAEHSSDVEFYKGIMGDIVVGTYSPLLKPNWALVVEAPWNEAYREVIGIILLSIMLFLVFSLLAGVLGTYIARRLAAPLVRLTKSAALIASGSAGERVQETGPMEVAGLAAAFNSMMYQLRQSYHNLKEQLAETMKNREALAESEERLRSIIDNASEIIYTLSSEGVLTFVSPTWTRLLGHQLSEVEGRHFSYFVHPEDIPACESFMKKVLQAGTSQQGTDYRVRHMDGTWRWHSSIGSLLAESKSGSYSFIGLAQDITWKKQAEDEKAKLEEQLHQAQKMESIGRLAGGVAHDFNNMLSVILGYAELIKLDNPSDDLLTAKIIEIEKAAGHARDITRQLLAFSRKQIISPVSLNINDLIMENHKMLARLIGEDIELRFCPAEYIWNVRLDPSQLNQVIYNLAVNARDAMPSGGKLTIETANSTIDDTYSREHLGFMPGNYVLLTISDNGIGMDRETQSHLFEPFFTTKETGKGTGLGLATVYGIIKQNGGFINVYSEPGKGTVFHIYFIRDTEGSETVTKAPENPMPSGGETLMLVEDDEMMRSMTALSLERIGYKVLLPETPMEALSICEKGNTPFVLLITDVIMPGMNGIELRDRIIEMRPGVKVLFMSGYTANTIVHHGVLQKDVHFIQKPFNLSELARKVREAIEY